MHAWSKVKACGGLLILHLAAQVDNVAHWGDILQMAVLELIRKVCRSNPNEKGKYIKIILALLQSTSSAVVYECAVTLVSLSNAPSAIKAAANCYCQMLVSQSDNNVKLIVLDRLQVTPLLLHITLQSLQWALVCCLPARLDHCYFHKGDGMLLCMS